MSKGDKKITWLIEHTVGARSWSPIGLEHQNHEKGSAEQLLKVKREENEHRDDRTRAETRPCTIWTKDGTWASYESCPTYYRLVKIIREVVNEDKPNAKD